MTDADKKRVLEACGYKHKNDAHTWEILQGNYHTPGWYKAGRFVSEDFPVLTLQELWEALCGLCREQKFGGKFPNFGEPKPIRAVLDGLDNKVTLFPGRTVIPIVHFTTQEYGSLTAAIEEALLWVLNRKEGGE